MSCNVNTNVNMHIFTHSCLIYTQAPAIKSQCSTCQSMTSMDTNVGETAEQRCHSYHHSGPHTELHPWERRERTVSFTSIKLGWASSEKPSNLIYCCILCLNASGCMQSGGCIYNHRLWKPFLRLSKICTEVASPPPSILLLLFTVKKAVLTFTCEF